MVIRISPREFFIRKLEEQKPLKEEPKERVEEKVEYLPPTLEYGHQQPKEIIKEIPVPVKAEDEYESTQRQFTTILSQKAHTL